jgi:hypothetical protein
MSKPKGKIMTTKVNTKPAASRFTDSIQIRFPSKLSPLLDHAAERRFQTPSEYARQAILAQLKADGELG